MLKVIYGFLFYSWALILLGNCAHVWAELDATDFTGVGAHMVDTSRDLKREREIAISKPYQPQFIQPRPAGVICTSELRKHPFYGHFESVEVCR